MASGSLYEPLKAVGRRARIFDRIIVAIAAVMVVYHLISIRVMLQEPFRHSITFILFSLVLVFLSTLMVAKSRWYRAWLWLILLATIYAGVYFHIEYLRLEAVVGFPTANDLIVGIILIIALIEATRQAFGKILPIVAGLFIAYFFLGHFLPDPFGFPYTRPELVVSYLGIGLTGFFRWMPIAANWLLPIIVFGSLVTVLGAHLFVMEVGKAIGRVTAGGAGHTAIVASAGIGTFTGVPLIDVALVGGFTIPNMKDSAYRPELAGGIASAAAMGAALMPPVMGFSAFLMAVFLAISYGEVIVAGIIPAILFYLALFTAVEVIARKEKTKPLRLTTDWNTLTNYTPLFVVPLVVLVILLLMRYTPGFAGLAAIIAIIVIALLRKQTRPSWSALFSGFTTGGLASARIGVAIGIVGMIAQALITTGAGVRLSGVVEIISGGNLFLALILIMIICIILGMGMPPVVAYSLLAMVVIPMLVRMGIMPMAAHFFVFYFAILAACSPPVALTAMVASSIAQSSFWRTGLTAFKLSIVGYIIPFMLVYNPAIIGHFTDPLSAVVSFLAIIGAIIALVMVLYGYFFTEVPLWARTFAVASAVILFAFAAVQEYLVFGIGLLLLIPPLLHQWRSRRLPLAEAVMLQDKE